MMCPVEDITLSEMLHFQPALAQNWYPVFVKVEREIICEEKKIFRMTMSFIALFKKHLMFKNSCGSKNVA